jgi:hypothetical protein
MGRLEFLLYDARIFFSALAIILLAPPLVFVAAFGTSAGALTLDSARDCDTNAIINCGALTIAELQQKYASSDIGPVYARFGITATEINNMDNNTGGQQTMAGRVTKDNTVIADGQVVATNAMTAGRQNMPGSTQESSGGITFYRRPPSVSFVSQTLPAFVVMENGRFAFAIIASCGNPVIGAPTAAEKPPAKPAVSRITTAPPPAPQPTPAPKITINNKNINNVTVQNANSQSQAQAQTPASTPVVAQASSQAQSAAATTQTASTTTTATSQAQAYTPTPASAAVVTTPTSTQTQTSTSKSLPNTGAGDTTVLAVSSTLLATLGHLIYQRRRLTS